MWDWEKGGANYKDFVISALTEALEIVEGDWDREDYWEIYVMSRQNLALAIELMKDMKVGNTDGYRTKL